MSTNSVSSKNILLAVKLTIFIASAIKYYGKGCYFATASGYSDNQYSYFLKGTKEDDSISTVNQMLLWNVIIGAYDYGSVALTNSQCLTNTKRQTDEIVNNLIE